MNASRLNPQAYHQRRQREFLGIVALFAFALLSFGLYLQHGVGLEPCPMCIVQRYALVIVMICAGLAGALPRGRGIVPGTVTMILFAGLGAFTAARQSWLQWNPPAFNVCGRDIFGMIESFPLQRAIPMIFQGSGDCSKIDWTFLGLSIANWSFLCFAGIVATGLALLLFRPKALA